jgi:predicted DNA-binding transcriptional regulator AlpA
MKLLWNLEEVATAVGVSIRLVQHWSSIGRLPACIRLGRSPRWRVSEIKKWVADGCPTCTEPQEDAIESSSDDDDSEAGSL